MPCTYSQSLAPVQHNVCSSRPSITHLVSKMIFENSHRFCEAGLKHCPVSYLPFALRKIVSRLILSVLLSVSYTLFVHIVLECIVLLIFNHATSIRVKA